MSAHHGFGPGADVPTGGALGNVDLQVAVGGGEPPGPLPLLLLHHELEGASHRQLPVLRWHGRHGGWNLHVVLRPRLLADDGVLVGVARSVALVMDTRTQEPLFWEKYSRFYCVVLGKRCPVLLPNWLPMATTSSVNETIFQSRDVNKSLFIRDLINLPFFVWVVNIILTV